MKWNDTYYTIVVGFCLPMSAALYIRDVRYLKCAGCGANLSLWLWGWPGLLLVEFLQSNCWLLTAASHAFTLLVSLITPPFKGRCAPMHPGQAIVLTLHVFVGPLSKHMCPETLLTDSAIQRAMEEAQSVDLDFLL